MLKRLCVILIGMTIAACSGKTETKDDTRYVKVFVVGDDANANISTFHGTIHAEFEPDLSFRVGGKIISRNVDIGQAVLKGQVLASLDPTDYKLSENSSVAQLAAAKSNYITQEANLARYKELLKQNFVSQAQYDTQKAQFDSAKAQYEQANNQLSNSKNQVSYTTLVAPADGVISSVTMDAGQVVSAGQTVAKMDVSGNKEVQVDLPEALINDYKVGMPAKIKIWATGKEYTGKIRIINQSSDQQTQTYTARVVIDNPGSDIKYGMAADVNIQQLNSQAGLSLPLNSLYAKDGKSFVWIINNSDQAQLVPVKVINTDGSFMKVDASGLHKGDKVVSAGANLIYEGQKLKIYSD